MHHFFQNAGKPPQPPTYRSSGVPRIRLPDPPSLYPTLITIGAEERVAREMDRAYNVRALELRSYYEQSISDAFAAIADSPFPYDFEKRILDKFASLYLTRVKSWIEDGVTVYKSSRKPVKLAPSDVEVPRNTNSRTAFNTDYIPLLEHFFDENPFPTHADKAFLAKKSGMAYRQIHVWFQNRRNRTKKANGSRRKRPTREGATRPLDSLRERAGKYTVYNEQPSHSPLEASHSGHSNEQNSTPGKRSSEKVLHHTAEDDNTLDRRAAPAHAFPSPYPPVRACESFPLESCGQMFSAFQWARRPNHVTSSQPHKTDIDDLVDRFALLSTISKKLWGMRASLAATCFITTRPPAAPHPALIKPAEVVSLPARRSSFPIVRASQPTTQAFTRPTASSTPIPPLSHPDNVSSSRRKVSPLPNRYPRQSLPCRNVTPDTSDVSSSTPSPCSSLRSLTDSFDFREVTSSPVPCTGPSVPHLLPPRPQACSAA
ncbi:hypothetical protein EV363DRAFT_1201276 [Boletus edulis]|nr:hypothetical protein EV363DRAFT_1201276 [Boletus edulis]